MNRSGRLRRDGEKAREFERRGRGGPLRSGELRRVTERARKFLDRGQRSSAKSLGQRRAVSPASTAQRVKVRDAVSIVSGQGPCDPVHLVDRSLGGCDDPLCVVPLIRSEHEAYERGELDLVPYLVEAGCTAEMGHALEHLGSPLRLIHKLTGVRHVPEAKL